MIDENVDCKPYKKGDRLILEVVITDEDKSFDFLAKSMMNKLDTDEFGFSLDKVSFWKDRYIDHIPLELRSEIVEKLQKYVDEIAEILNNQKQSICK